MMYADEREIDTLLREISDAVGAAVDREDPTPFAVPPRRGAVRFAACALAVVAVGAGAVWLDRVGDGSGSVADDVGLVCPERPLDPTGPDLLTQLREYEGSPGPEDDGVERYQQMAATGFMQIGMRDVFGRVGVERLFDERPVETKCDLGPVLAIDSDEVIAWFGPGIGVVTLEEYESIETDADVAALATERKIAAGCPEGQEAC